MADPRDRSRITVPRNKTQSRPFNLVADPPKYHTFNSMDERGKFIVNYEVGKFIDKVETLVTQEMATGERPPEFGSSSESSDDSDDGNDGAYTPGEIVEEQFQDWAMGNPNQRGEENLMAPRNSSVIFDEVAGLEDGRLLRSRSMSTSRSRSGDRDDHDDEDAYGLIQERDRSQRGESPSGRRSRSRSRSRSRDRDRGQSPALEELGDTVQDGNPVNPEDPLGFSTQLTIFQFKEIERCIKHHLKKMNLSFVGAQQSYLGYPCRGDLIIAHPGGRRLSLPNSVGYLGTYSRPGDFIFSNRDLVVRCGSFEVRPASRGGVQSFVYRPFRELELHAYSRRLGTYWKYLGDQVPLQNQVLNPYDNSSPGKYLRVGSPVLGTQHMVDLIPRRGDLIIRGECWIENFSHNANFWHSMIKWHRNRPYDWVAGDMLIRRFIDMDKSPRRDRPFAWGWAELFRYEGPAGLGGSTWIFIGRTKHIYDTPWEPRSFYLLTYACDKGEDSDDDDHI